MASKVLEDYRFSVALELYAGGMRKKNKLRLDNSKELIGDSSVTRNLLYMSWIRWI